MTQPPFPPVRLTLLMSAVLALSACSSTSELFESKEVDYKSVGKIPDLSIPPDLTQPKKDDRFAVPDIGGKGSATYSAYQAERQGVSSASQDVLPKAGDIKIERDGKNRWLSVPGTPDKLWSQIKDFWQDTGFIINVESPQSGVMETDWAENRAKIPDGMIRGILGKALDTLYSTSERDKFRTRLEPGRQPGTTEVYISHRGMYEVYVNEGKTETRWQPRPEDPNLEAEMLSRLMVRLGADQKRAKAEVMQAVKTPIAARAQLQADGAALALQEGFDRAWRTVGLALDRSNFTIEDRDRSKGEYLVRYVDSDVDIANQKKSGGLLSKLAFWRDDKAEKIQPAPYRVLLQGQGDDRTKVTVLAQDEATRASAAKILKLLFDRVK